MEKVMLLVHVVEGTGIEVNVLVEVKLHAQTQMALLAGEIWVVALHALRKIRKHKDGWKRGDKIGKFIPVMVFIYNATIEGNREERNEGEEEEEEEEKEEKEEEEERKKEKVSYEV